MGLFGLVSLLPPIRNRRTRRVRQCTVCLRHQTWRRTGIAVFALCMLAGATVRAALAGAPAARCGAGHAIQAIKAPAPGPPAPWRLTRDVVTAPITGTVQGYVAVRRMGICSLGSLNVAVLPHAATTSGTSGTTIGNVFLQRTRARLPPGRAAALGRHESHHVDQWTVLTLAGGPLALPVLYGIDEIFFPGPRNHFERAAGLRAGGYPRPAGYGPRPIWSAAAVLAAIAALLGWRRLRWLSRRLVKGKAAARHASPGRCPLHSQGWLRTR